MTSLVIVLSSSLWIPELYGKIEKISGKVEEVNNEIIDDLFVLLWYDQTSHRLRINHSDDIDLWHQDDIWSTITRGIKQIDTIIDTDVSWSTSIVLSGVIKNPLWSLYHIRLSSTMTKRHIEKLSEISATDDIHQTSLLLSCLFALALGEYAETLQDDDWTIRCLIRSGHNAVDYRGNIAGVLTHLNNNTIEYDEYIRIVKQLQERYSVRSANDIVKGLSQEFDFDMTIIHYKK